MNAALDQSRRKASMVAQGDGKFGPEADPRIPPNNKTKMNEFLELRKRQFRALKLRHVRSGPADKK